METSDRSVFIFNFCCAERQNNYNINSDPPHVYMNNVHASFYFYTNNCNNVLALQNIFICELVWRGLTRFKPGNKILVVRLHFLVTKGWSTKFALRPPANYYLLLVPHLNYFCILSLIFLNCFCTYLPTYIQTCFSTILDCPDKCIIFLHFEQPNIEASQHSHMSLDSSIHQCMRVMTWIHPSMLLVMRHLLHRPRGCKNPTLEELRLRTSKFLHSATLYNNSDLFVGLLVVRLHFLGTKVWLTKLAPGPRANYSLLLVPHLNYFCILSLIFLNCFCTYLPTYIHLCFLHSTYIHMYLSHAVQLVSALECN